MASASMSMSKASCTTRAEPAKSICHGHWDECLFHLLHDPALPIPMSAVIYLATNGGPSYPFCTLLFAYTHVYSAPNRKICAE
jgi:hypothetical protein